MATDEPIQRDYYTPGEYAKAKGLKADDVYAWCTIGALPAINTGKCSRAYWRIPKRLGDEWYEQKALAEAEARWEEYPLRSHFIDRYGQMRTDGHGGNKGPLPRRSGQIRG